MFFSRHIAPHLRVLQLSVLLSISFTWSSLHAADNEPENHERWYQVEMIIFSRSESNPQEEWPKDIKLSYPNNLINLKPSGTDTEGFNVVLPNERLLNAQAATLAKSGSYAVLFHQAWRQQIRAHNQSIFISGGKSVNGHQELEGSISLSVSVFLKLQTNLWLTQFGLQSTEPNEGWPELPLSPFSAPTETDQHTDLVTKRVIKFSQQRSMRSNEVHYIDHPLMGVIVKIVPYDMPVPKTDKAQ